MPQLIRVRLHDVQSAAAHALKPFLCPAMMLLLIAVVLPPQEPLLTFGNVCNPPLFNRLRLTYSHTHIFNVLAVVVVTRAQSAVSSQRFF